MREDKAIIKESKEDINQKKQQERDDRLKAFEEIKAQLDQVEKKIEGQKSTSDSSDSSPSRGGTQVSDDPREKIDFEELLGRKNDFKQNDMPITNALSKSDLDMALYYVLDQVVPLEHFMVGIIEYYELIASGQTIPKNQFSSYLQLITLVEEWMKLSAEQRRMRHQRVQGR